MFLCVLGLNVPSWVVLLKTILRSHRALVLSFFSRGECFSFPNCVRLITTLRPPRVSLFRDCMGLSRMDGDLSAIWTSRRFLWPWRFFCVDLFFGLLVERFCVGVRNFHLGSLFDLGIPTCVCQSFLCVSVTPDLLVFRLVGERGSTKGRQASYFNFLFFSRVRPKLFFVFCVTRWVWFLDLGLCSCQI